MDGYESKPWDPDGTLNWLVFLDVYDCLFNFIPPVTIEVLTHPHPTGPTGLPQHVVQLVIHEINTSGHEEGVGDLGSAAHWGIIGAPWEITWENAGKMMN